MRNTYKRENAKLGDHFRSLGIKEFNMDKIKCEVMSNREEEREMDDRKHCNDPTSSLKAGNFLSS
jgi:hypothetical protein